MVEDLVEFRMRMHNHALHRTAAKRFSFDAPDYPDAGFAASARFRRRSVS